MMRRKGWWGLLVIFSACGGGAASLDVDEIPPPPTADEMAVEEMTGDRMAEMNAVSTTRTYPEDPIAMVRFFESIATGARAGDLSDHFNLPFMELLNSGGEFRDLFLDVPDGCVPELSVEGGYNAVAVPPAGTDDTEEQAARIERVIRILQQSTEVHAQCTIETVELEIEGREQAVNSREQVLMLYAIALGRSEGDPWHVLAWRDFRAERTLHH